MSIIRNGITLSQWNGLFFLSSINTKSIISMPLDNVSAVLAFSTARKLRDGYTGDLIRVRETGGDTETDIGVDTNDELDEGALLTHMSSNDGFVTTLYDQSGNASDATQSTAANQPRIALAGAVEKISEQPSAYYIDDGVNFDFFLSPTGLLDLTGGFAALAVINVDEVGYKSILDSNDGTSGGVRFQFRLMGSPVDGAIQVKIFDGSTSNWIARRTDVGAISPGVTYVVHFTYDGGSSQSGIKIYINGVQSDTTDQSAGTFTAPDNASGSNALRVGYGTEGYMPEVIVLESTDVGSIPDNMMDYYGIS